MKNRKVWFVTGASKGLGQVLVKRLLREGYSVAATSRHRSALVKSIGEHPNFLPLEVDLGNEASVNHAISTSLSTFGQLDIVVNNAGYGQGGAVEEVTNSEAEENFKVNVFGILNIIRATAPVLREQRSGHIFNVSSIGGFVGGFSGWGVYCATKFAVTGLTEALDADLKSFGVHATVVYPGYFRTSFLENESMKLPSQPIAAYQGARDSMKLHQEKINGNQPGDPEKAAEVMIKVSNDMNPPLHLLLGSDAFNMAKSKIEQLQTDFNRMKQLTVSTDF